MPGAPNRPPEGAPAPPPPPVDELERKVLRRLAPARVALRLDLWKGAPGKDLLDPFTRAESLYGAGDHRGADAALDQFSVRLAEPRWPTIPEPFRQLRVAIPAPMPPHYDPENALAAEVREANRARREAVRQLALAKASVAWARAHAVTVDDLDAPVAAAEAALTASGPAAPFWTPVDAVWAAIRERVPPPSSGKAPAPAPAEPA